MEATIEVYFDNRTGQIDYENPINSFPVQIWPCWQGKAGFGLSCFGESDFGYDGAAAIGFGLGLFGQCQFGFDEDFIEWVSEPLTAGTYQFAVKVIDRYGNKSSASQTGQITVMSAAVPAEDLSVSSFDKQTNELVLSIS